MLQSTAKVFKQKGIQWNRTHLGPRILSFVERLSSFGGYFVWSVYTRGLLVCPFVGGLSSFRTPFMKGFTTYIGPYSVRDVFNGTISKNEGHLSEGTIITHLDLITEWVSYTSQWNEQGFCRIHHSETKSALQIVRWYLYIKLKFGYDRDKKEIDLAR